MPQYYLQIWVSEGEMQIYTVAQVGHGYAVAIYVLYVARH